MSPTTTFNESAPATECVSLPITVPRETATPIVDTLFTGLATTPGFIAGVWGYELEDPTQNHWFLTWETLAAHVALTQTPAYIPFVEKIQTIASNVGFTHAGLQRRDALEEAPVLEWVKVWLKEETDKAEWVKGLEPMEKLLEETARAKGYYGLSSGWVKEEAGRYDILIGWESMEAHKEWKAGQSEERLGRVMAFLRGDDVERLELRHVQVESRVVKA